MKKLIGILFICLCMGCANNSPTVEVEEETEEEIEEVVEEETKDVIWVMNPSDKFSFATEIMTPSVGFENNEHIGYSPEWSSSGNSYFEVIKYRPNAVSVCEDGHLAIYDYDGYRIHTDII